MDSAGFSQDMGVWTARKDTGTFVPADSDLGFVQLLQWSYFQWQGQIPPLIHWCYGHITSSNKRGGCSERMELFFCHTTHHPTGYPLSFHIASSAIKQKTIAEYCSFLKVHVCGSSSISPSCKTADPAIWIRPHLIMRGTGRKMLIAELTWLFLLPSLISRYW